MDSLGKRIRRLRGARSQATYAAQLGISKGALGSYERDSNSPNALVLSAICTQESVSADWLLLGREVPPAVGTQAAGNTDDARMQDVERRLEFVESMVEALIRARRPRGEDTSLSHGPQEADTPPVQR